MTKLNLVCASADYIPDMIHEGNIYLWETEGTPICFVVVSFHNNSPPLRSYLEMIDIHPPDADVIVYTSAMLDSLKDYFVSTKQTVSYSFIFVKVDAEIEGKVG